MTSESPLNTIIRQVEAAAGEYALVGAAARNAWAPPRLTTDLDFAITADETTYRRLIAAMAGIGYLPVAEYRAEPEDAIPAVALFRNDAASAPYRQVDVLIAGTEFERQAIERALTMPLGDVRVRVVTREDLIVYKLIAWRPRDRLDIQDVIATAAAAGVELDWDRIREWAAAWEVEDRLEEARRQAGV